MIKIENCEVMGWEHAIRGMRNPLNSWDKSDSYWTYIENPQTMNTAKYQFFVGEEDLKLMKKLAKAGSDHGKFLRYIDVYFDVEAPLYWWKEMETYRVGVAENPSDIEFNSCSTMHKIHAKKFELDDFSHEHLIRFENVKGTQHSSTEYLSLVIFQLNYCRDRYLETKDKKYWWQMIQLLPSSYNQKRTVKLNYQVLKQMYFARKNHKLDEWRELCDWIESLPYSELITGEGNGTGEKNEEQ